MGRSCAAVPMAAGRRPGSAKIASAKREARGNGDTLRFDCAGKPHDFALADVPVAPAVAPMPGNLAVLSDLEGNIRFLDAALARLGIVGDDGRWQYGNGHLVVLGDVVDRGRDVYAVLWRLHDLAGQAHAAGGALHLVLGNHEQYILRGNHSRAHPEHRHAMREMGGFERAFAGDTVIGAWLRAQPVALKLGRVLFVHGGVSPTLADAGLSVEALNSAMRDYWRAPPGAVARTPALDAVLGNTGVTQYRGFFEERKNAYPMASQADVERVLAHFGADQVVVGHTLVERVERRYDDRVFAIDVNDDEARPEVLVYAQGVPAVIDIGESRALRTQPPLRLREFSLFDPADRRLLGDMYRAYRELGRIAQPY